ncbi:GNAT family N-acetyltransferase [Fulvivirga sp. RKSG066]|nr:GNAT family N-acetyltransferase [Fulvivirga aurantia]
MENVSLRQIDQGDLEELQRIGKETFSESFGALNTAADMDKYLNASFSSGQLLTELNDNETDFYFAELENEAVGYLKVNWGKAQTEIIAPNMLEIERIYVLAWYQGMRIGHQLYEKAIEIAKNKGFSKVWLGVWEKNRRAIKFYERLGFKAFDSHDFLLGNDRQTDILMRLDLNG